METFYRCNCYNEVLAVEKCEDWREVEFCIYRQSGHSLIQRLRYCLRILRTGTPYGDQIVLDNDTARQLGQDLIEMVETNAAEEE